MCFSLQWVEDVIIWVIVLCAVIALIRLLVNFVVPRLGLSGDVVAFVVQALTIVMWAIICVALVVFVFDLVACLAPSLSMPRIR